MQCRRGEDFVEEQGAGCFFKKKASFRSSHPLTDENSWLSGIRNKHSRCRHQPFSSKSQGSGEVGTKASGSTIGDWLDLEDGRHGPRLQLGASKKCQAPLTFKDTILVDQAKHEVSTARFRGVQTIGQRPLSSRPTRRVSPGRMSVYGAEPSFKGAGDRLLRSRAALVEDASGSCPIVRA
jgi:hypothetical protein